MSLKVKVHLFFATLLIISLLATTGVLISNARHSVKSDMEATMAAAARLMTASLSGDSLSREIGIYQHMNQLVKVLGEIRSLHILLFDTKSLLFEGEPPNIVDEAVKPPDWFVKMLFPKVTPLTRRFGNGHMVIYAAPLQEISDRWLDFRAILELALGIFVFVGLLLYWGVGWVLKPLDRLLAALSSFEQGDLHLRLPSSSLTEMNRLSQAFNRMGQTLELSIEENRRLATLVKQTGYAVLSLDDAGKITFCNPAAERLFNHHTSLVGETAANLGFTENHSQIIEILENGKTIENLETSLPLPNGEIAAILFSTTPLVDPDGMVRGTICTLRDITELKQAEAAKNQLRETRLLAHHMAEAQEAERRHLARELHDELGQCLTAIKTDAVLIRNRTETTEPKVYKSAQAIIDVASHIYDVVHNMITRLRPSPLDDLGLIPTLQECISAWQKRQPDIAFILNISGKLDNLNETINMTVFRVVQEAITNAIRHADASEMIISISNNLDDKKQQYLLVIEITDNGKGMEIQDFHSDVDFGLLGMRERAHSLGGTFSLKSSFGMGLTIRVMLPIEIGAIETKALELGTFDADTLKADETI